MIAKKNYPSSLKKIPTFLLVVLTVAFLSSCTSNQNDNAITSTPGNVNYSQDVAPILASRCEKCHGNSRQDGQLDLSSYNAIMAGGKNGQVIVPGSADDSKLILMVSSGKMPKKGAKLTQDQIKMLEDWINAGAKNN